MKPCPILLVTLATMLSGCSYSYELHAFEQNGSIVIEPISRQGNGCLSSFSVNSIDGVVLWELTRPYREAVGDCEMAFPLTYGVVPSQMSQSEPAKPLQAGVVYKMLGSDGDEYYGAFKLREGIIVENVGLPAGSFAND